MTEPFTGCPDIRMHPRFEYAMTVSITLAGSDQVRPSPYGGERWMVYIREGTVRGPGISGIVVPGSGGDYPMWRQDGVIDFDARYTFRTDDGVSIYVQNRGYRWARPEVMEAMGRREEVAFDDYYMRVAPKFEAPTGPYEWLGRHVFVGVAEKVPEGNRIHYFKLL